MRKRTKIIAVTAVVIFLALFTATNTVNIPGAPRFPWFPQSSAKAYVSNLISGFTADVQDGQARFPNFTLFKDNFQLYHEVGQNFRVQVMRYAPGDNNSVGFTFEPIAGNDPVVIIDNNDTIQGLFQTPPITQGGQTYIFNPCTGLYTSFGTACVYYGVNYPQYAKSYPIIWVTGSECVLHDTTGDNSKGAADGIYREDVAHSKLPNSTVTRTYTTNPTLAQCLIDSGGNVSLPYPSPVDRFYADVVAFLTWVNENIIVKTVVTVFGGLGVFLLAFYGFFRKTKKS